MSDWVKSWWFVVVAVLAVGLRVELARENRFSNDDQMRVVELILQNPDRVLVMEDCWQCYHVKAYHQSVAMLARAAGPMSKERLIHLGQWVNVTFGVLTLLVLVLAISAFPVRRETRLLVFTLAALNPRFVGVNAQASNDTLVILMGALTCWALCRYVTGARWWWLAGAGAAALVSLFSKGSGIFVCFGLAGVLVFRLWAQPASRRLELGALVVFVALVASGLRWGSPYRQQRERHGSPFITVDEPVPVKTLVSAPRTSTPAALDTFGTFRFGPALQMPSIEADGVDSPASLFTHLYGRALHIRFDEWPPEWRIVRGESALRAPAQNVGRAMLVLGLIPFFLWFVGLQRMAQEAWASFRRKGDEETPRAVALLVMGGALVGMCVAFVWGGPYLRFMKFIYLLPAGIPFVYALARGYDAAMELPWLRRVALASTALYAVLACADVGLLIRQLASI